MTSFRGVSVVVLEGQSISERELLSGSNPAVYDAVFARSNVYATSFNARCVYSLATDGSSELEINPYPGGENVAGPELIERSSDEQAVYFTDELNEAIHKIDTTSDLVVDTFSTGYDLTSFCITLEGTRAVLAAGRATERLLIVDLTAPSAVPDLVNIKEGWFPWNTVCSPTNPDRVLVLARHQITGGYQPYEDLDFRKLFLFDLAEDSILGELTVPDTVNVLAVFPDFSGGLLLDTAGSVLFFEID